MSFVAPAIEVAPYEVQRVVLRCVSKRVIEKLPMGHTISGTLLNLTTWHGCEIRVKVNLGDKAHI